MSRVSPNSLQQNMENKGGRQWVKSILAFLIWKKVGAEKSWKCRVLSSLCDADIPCRLFLQVRCEGTDSSECRRPVHMSAAEDAVDVRGHPYQDGSLSGKVHQRTARITLKNKQYWTLDEPFIDREPKNWAHLNSGRRPVLNPRSWL